MDGFEWGEDKPTANLRARGVDFLRAVRIFRGPVLAVADDRNAYGEVRWRALGEAEGEYFLVVYTWRGENRRIISAWRLGRRGNERYQASLGPGDRSHDRRP